MGSGRMNSSMESEVATVSEAELVAEVGIGERKFVFGLFWKELEGQPWRKKGSLGQDELKEEGWNEVISKEKPSQEREG
jgi:hypothetical protein